MKKNIKNIFAAMIYLSFSATTSFAITDALKIKIAAGSYSDETIIRFISGATNGFDGSYDAWKLFSGNTAVPNIFSKDNTGDELTINAMPEFTASSSQDIFLRTGAAATYSITAEEIGSFASGVCILMKDLVTGQLYDMRTANTYLMNLPFIAKTDSARFRVFFSYPASLQPVSATCSNCGDGSVTISKTGQSNWQYSIINSSATIIASGTAPTGTLTIYGLAAGNYSVTVNSDFSCAEMQSFAIKFPVTYYSRASGNWETPSVWSTASCGGAVASSVPGSGDNIIICAGKKITLNTNTSCHTITINGTLICNAGLAVSGNWINNGIFSAGTETITFNGSKLQGIGGNKITTFNNLFVDNSTPTEAIRLNISTTVNGVLTLKDGHITTTYSKILTCGPSSSIALIALLQDSSFIKGPMKHTVNVSSPVIKIFPVGKDNSYRRMDLFIDQKSNTKTIYTSEMLNSSASSLGYILPKTVSNVSNIRYYQIKQSPLVALDSARISIYFNCAGVSDQVNSLAGLSIVKDNGYGSWLDLHNNSNGNICDPISYSGSAVSKSFTSFKGSKFCLGNTNNSDGFYTTDDNTKAAIAAKVKVDERVNPSLTIYPNPATDDFIINISGRANEEAEIVISDMSGRICYTQMVAPAANNESIKINIANNLKPGIYLVALLNNGSMDEKLLIVK